jgi:hypothetical protein
LPELPVLVLAPQRGDIDWKAINPDIFGSIIQAVADSDERGELGTHYTSVPNILKVLDPLFLDDLREKLAEAGDNRRKLQNLRKRLARIRAFDPACGSGNFLVIAYRQLREIERRVIIRLRPCIECTCRPDFSFRRGGSRRDLQAFQHQSRQAGNSSTPLLRACPTRCRDTGSVWPDSEAAGMVSRTTPRHR